MLFPGNLYQGRGRRCWYKCHWAGRSGRHSLPKLGMNLGTRVRTGFHLHLSSLHHMLWIVHRHGTQSEILCQFYCHLSGIWNQCIEIINIIIVVTLYVMLLHPEHVLTWLNEKSRLTATKFFQDKWSLWRAISDLKIIISTRDVILYINEDKI